MPAMVGENDASVPYGVPFIIVPVINQITHEITNAIRKNHVTGCVLIVETMILGSLTFTLSFN